MVAVCLLTHFNVADAIAALLHVGNLSGRVVGRSGKYGDRNYGGKGVGESDGKEKVEASVLVSTGGVYICGGVPGINGRRAIGGWPITEILLDLGKGAAGIYNADADFLNGIAHTIAHIVRSMQIAGVRRFGHQDPHVLCADGRVGEFQVDRSTLRLLYCPAGESFPLALRSRVEVERARSYPILHGVGRGIRAGPGDANRVHRLFGTQVHDDPLRVPGIALSGEPAREVRMTLPIAEIGTLQRTVAAGRETAVRQCVGKNVAHRLLEFSASGEVSALVRGIAPGSVLGPVPGRHAKFGIVAISNRSPTRRE